MTQNQIPFLIANLGTQYDSSKIDYSMYDIYLNDSDTDGFTIKCMANS